MWAGSHARQRWAQAVHAGRFGVWDLDPVREEVHYSPQWKARLGFPRIDAADSTAFWRCRVHPADLDPMSAALRLHLDNSSSCYEMRFRLRSNGSGYRTVVSRGRVVSRDHLGQATRMIGTMVDITPRPMANAGAALVAENCLLPVRSSDVPFHVVLGDPGLAPGHGLLDQAAEMLDAAFSDAACLSAIA